MTADQLDLFFSIFGPRKVWYVQEGDGTKITGHQQFKTQEEVRKWISGNSHAAFYFQVQGGSKTQGERPNADEIDTLFAFPVDIDPATKTRPATDEERAPCLEVARRIDTALQNKGFAPSMMIDSGNGTQVFLRIHVEIRDEKEREVWRDLFVRIQEWIQDTFSDPRVEIDSVADFSRIMALPGTEKRKVRAVDSPSKERPFRTVTVLTPGDVTPTEVFKSFASSLPKTEKAESDSLRDVELRIVDDVPSIPPRAVDLLSKRAEDESETEFAVACALAENGFDPNQIYTVLQTASAIRAEDDPKRWRMDYYRMTIRKAVDATSPIRNLYAEIHEKFLRPVETAMRKTKITVVDPKTNEATRVPFEMDPVKEWLEEFEAKVKLPPNEIAHFTDLGLAQRFLYRFKDTVRFCPETKSYFVWNGRCWSEDVGEGQIHLLMETTVALIELELRLVEANVDLDEVELPPMPALPADTPAKKREKAMKAYEEMVKPIKEKQEKDAKKTDKLKDEVRAFARKSESASSFRAALDHVSKKVLIRYTKFDTNKYLLNCANGTLDLKTGVMRKPSQDDYVTVVLPWNYSPDAVAPRFLKALEEWHPSPDVREHLQRFAGYSLSGDTSERKFRLDHGWRGNNGKSSLYSVMLSLLGPYANVTSFDTIAARTRANGSDPRDDLAALKGARLVVVIETSKQMRLDENQVKTMTGNDTITCRHLYGRFFNYEPEFKLWIATNNRPKITDAKPSIWNRMDFIEWKTQISPDKMDKHLREKFMEEMEGVLAWAVGGYRKWQEDGGLTEPEELKTAKAIYQNDENILGDFLNEMTQPFDGWTNFKDLYENCYLLYCARRQVPIQFRLSRSSLSAEMSDRGYERRTGHAGALEFYGLRPLVSLVSQISQVGRVFPKDTVHGETSNFDIRDSQRDVIANDPNDSPDSPNKGRKKASDVQKSTQATLEQAVPELKPMVDNTLAVQARVAEDKGEASKYESTPPVVRKIAAFDLETVNLDVHDPNNRVLSIGFSGSDGFRECWMEGLNVADEKETIAAFIAKAREYDGLLGWNTDGFDLPVLDERLRVNGTTLGEFDIPPVLDCLRAHKLMLRKVETKNHLDWIAKKYLKEGKKDFDPTKTFEHFKTPEGREKLREYNVHDADLVLRLDSIMGYWATFTSIYEESKCDAEKWQYDVKAFAAKSDKKQDNGFVWWRPIMGLIQRYCEKHEIENPFDWPNEVEKQDRKMIVAQERPGGYVMSPVKGHHERVIELDFSSLYPSLLMSFNMGADTAMPPGNGDIRAPFCSYESPLKHRSIIAGTLEELRAERQAVKAQLVAAKVRGASREETAALKGRTEALKILLNSFYGQLYAPFSSIFHFDSARNITTLGQEAVKLMIDSVKAFGGEAVAGDTDSVYVKVPPEKFNEEFAEELSKTLTALVSKHLKDKYGVDYIGTFDVKGLFDHMSIEKKKRYAKLEHGKPVEEMDVIGYERGDVFELQLDLQEEIFRCQFTGRDIQTMLDEAHTKFKTERDDTKVLRWRRGQTSAEGRALHRLMEVGLPPIPGDSVGFLILGKGTKKSPQRRIAARRLDSETVEWVTETDSTPYREKTFLTEAEEEEVWQQIVEKLDGTGIPRKEKQKRQKKINADAEESDDAA